MVEGTARVVLREDQFDDVRAGDILVCHMTNPAWVVLFTKIAGLGHQRRRASPLIRRCCSREFGIPAVVGTQDATKRIKNGDRIRVDGTTGTVDILERAAQFSNDLMRSAMMATGTDRDALSPLQQTAATATDIWNDSCAVDELDYAIAHGAVGATANPTIVHDVWKKDPDRWGRRVRELAARAARRDRDAPGLGDRRGDVARGAPRC